MNIFGDLLDVEHARWFSDGTCGPTGTRTRDLRIKSPQLYRLSYQPLY
jgi:hypothetical protein